MKKNIFPVLLSVCVASSLYANDNLAKELAEMKKQIAELKAAQEKVNIDALKRQLSEVKAHDANDNIKWSVDFRTAYDIVDYKINNMSDVDNAVWTNKLILGIAAQPLDNLVFKGSLGVYKEFGQNQAASANGFQNMDWFATQTPSGDADVRFREGYFLYFGEMGEVPYTASFGRRPSTDGFLVNYREDNKKPQSPIGHNINMEFDGASFMFNLENVVDISGLYFKLCLGRGNSDANAKYPGFTGYPVMVSGVVPSTTYTPYATSGFDSANMDLAGILMQLYNDGQYKVMANYFQGWNMMGANFAWNGNGADGAMGTADDTWGVNLTDVGDMTGGAVSFEVNGLSEENDFLMDTVAFASFAWSKTDPKGSHTYLTPMGPTNGSEMLGSTKSETGTSYYVGVNFPGFLGDDRIGIEYNHGSKYWRSFTYGEDTLAGSKLATRGDAYEIFYNFPILGKNLTGQIRYTYIDYDYTGSDMFFGSTGTPYDADTTPGAVDTAQDIRLSLRYRY